MSRFLLGLSLSEDVAPRLQIGAIEPHVSRIGVLHRGVQPAYVEWVIRLPGETRTYSARDPRSPAAYDGTRVSMGDVLLYLAGGISDDDILADFRQLATDEIREAIDEGVGDADVG